jgi:hypothetical protein
MFVDPFGLRAPSIPKLSKANENQGCLQGREASVTLM